MLNFLLETVFNPPKTYNLFLCIVVIGSLSAMIFNIRKEIKECGYTSEGLVSGHIVVALMGFIPVLNGVVVVSVITFGVFTIISKKFERIFKNRKEKKEVDKENK